MTKYPVKERLLHDGGDYEHGDSVEMAEEQAAELIAIGVLGEPHAGSDRPENVDVMNAAIRDAVGLLDADNATLWTGSGKAKVESIEAVLGYAVTAAERDSAMADA